MHVPKEVNFMNKKVAILAGDGIGQEVVPQAIRVLQVALRPSNQAFSFHYCEVGGRAYEKYGFHLPEPTLELCKKSDAILFGSVGGPVSEQHLKKWKNCEVNTILALRKQFNLGTNLRPTFLYPALLDISPLKKERVGQGVDLLIVRELTGDIYFGEHKRFVHENKRNAYDVAEYNEDQIATCVHHAFKAAQQRGKHLTSVDKANVLATSRLWRQVVTEISQAYPDVTLNHMLVDNCAMQLIIKPTQFDVIVTANLFGDILSDTAGAIVGSLGLMPSASFNDQGMGLYEPSGGSAPDIAGQNIANPIAQILSAAMMLRYSFANSKQAKIIEQAVSCVLDLGYRTQDIYTPGTQLLGTVEMADQIIAELQAIQVAEKEVV